MSFGTITVLLYYWYFFVHGRFGEAVFWPEGPPLQSTPQIISSSSTSQPQQQQSNYPAGFQVISLSDNTIGVVSDQNKFLFVLDLSSHTSYHVLPNHTVATRDSCHGKPAGSVVPAKGLELYDYLKKYVTATENETPEEAATSRDDVLISPQLGSEKAFYFSCGKGGRIDRLHVCSPGTLFDSRGRCEPIDPCKEGLNSTLPDVFDRHFYYRCDGHDNAGLGGGGNTRVECPNDMYFFYDSCRPIEDLEIRCRNITNGFLAVLDRKTFLMCEDTRVIAFQCNSPKEEPFLENDGRVTCVSTVCRGKKKGHRVPLEEDSETHFPFVYTPGYQLCGSKGDVEKTVVCPKAWNRKGEGHLSGLPMLFDGNDCVTPVLCENVDLQDNSMRGEVVVSDSKFQTVSKEWPLAALFDSTKGYNCEGRDQKRPLKRLRKTIEAGPGQVVKKFRFDSGCDSDGSGQKIPVVNSTTAYFDCDSNRVVECPDDHFFFGGQQCQRKDEGPGVFETDGIQLFRLYDGRFTLNFRRPWITTWDYSNQPSPYKTLNQWKPCTAPESLYLPGYNVCAHPDCKNFAHVLWLEGAYAITEDGSICSRNAKDKTRLSKLNTAYYEDGFDFWTQRGRLVIQPKVDFWEEDTSSALPRTKPATTDCTFGQKLQTGYFAMDQTIRATCDSRMPFLFCPHPNATIQQVSSDGVYACVPPEETYFLEPNEKHVFLEHELAKVVPIHPNTQIDLDEMGFMELGPDGMEIDGRSVVLRVDKRVKLEFIHTPTYPPFVYYNSRREAVLSPRYRTGYNYLPKVNDWTLKPLRLPEYETKGIAEGYSFPV